MRDLNCLEKKKSLLTPNLYLAKVFFKKERKIKTFSNKQKLREFITSGPILQEILKRVFQDEMKDTRQ